MLQGELRVREEREKIARARISRGIQNSSGLVGLALSSGGIRSATFCLGVLQGLAAAGLLRGIDYLSCVGGGGYIGGRVPAMIARDGFAGANRALSREQISLPEAPSRRFALISAIAVLGPPLLGLAGSIPFFARIFVQLLPLERLSVTSAEAIWSLGDVEFQLIGLALILAGAGLFTWAKFFGTGRLISHFVGKRYLEGDIPLEDLWRDGPYPLFGAVRRELKRGARGEWEPVVLSPDDRYSAAEAITASGPPPDTATDYTGPLSRLSLLLARDRSPISQLFPGSLFDSLGIYELVRRRCDFVIACDGTDDPDTNFEALARVIRECRLDLGVEIEFSVSPVSQDDKNRARKHYQIGSIQYPDGKNGFLLLLKPTLTGDESTDLLHYASAHPRFPMSDVRPGKFDEAERECYRRLGEHVIESLRKEVPDSDEWPRASFEQIWRGIRQQLRPDLKEVEPSPAPTEIPAELTAAIASGECILCAGAGLAAQSGLPTWPLLLRGTFRWSIHVLMLQPQRNSKQPSKPATWRKREMS